MARMKAETFTFVPSETPKRIGGTCCISSIRAASRAKRRSISRWKISDAGSEEVFLSMTRTGAFPGCQAVSWEWMWAEPFARHLPGRCEAFVEPVWKMLWSNKAFLVLMWETFEGHPNLLKADFTPATLGKSYASKPFFRPGGIECDACRSGNGRGIDRWPLEGPAEGLQALHPGISFEGNHPVIGSWVIGGEPGGIGIREDLAR